MPLLHSVSDVPLLLCAEIKLFLYILTFFSIDSGIFLYYIPLLYCMFSYLFCCPLFKMETRQVLAVSLIALAATARIPHE